VRTRVGYAGGTTQNPTYHDLDGHSECVQLEFDPTRITYEQLINMFWHSHNPEVRPWSWQYASIIFYHTPEQQRLAEETKIHIEETLRKVKVYTQIIHYTDFYPAEDFHQKYWLQNSAELMQEFRRIYPNFKDIVNSTAAARVNGILGGHAKLGGTMEELSSYGLSAECNKMLMDTIRRTESKLDHVAA
jgi:peptide-methionine (S)-S-oxide reductase